MPWCITLYTVSICKVLPATTPDPWPPAMALIWISVTVQRLPSPQSRGLKGPIARFCFSNCFCCFGVIFTISLQHFVLCFLFICMSWAVAKWYHPGCLCFWTMSMSQLAVEAFIVMCLARSAFISCRGQRPSFSKRNCLMFLCTYLCTFHRWDADLNQLLNFTSKQHINMCPCEWVNMFTPFFCVHSFHPWNPKPSDLSPMWASWISRVFTESEGEVFSPWS